MTYDALSSLLSNPAALSGIASLLSNMQAPPPAHDKSAQSCESESTEQRQTQDASDNTQHGTGGGGAIGGNGGTGGGGTGGIDLSCVLSALSNPAVVNSIRSLAPMMIPLLSSQPKQDHAPCSEGTGAGGGGLGGLGGLGALGGLGGACPRPVYPTDRRCALLLALKPYMPEDKRSAIDTIVRVIEIMSAI